MDEIFLKRIATYQLLNINYNADLGLFKGKMGCAIFFYLYARYTHNPLYSDFAGDLLDDIIEAIYREITLDFYNGLSGIGFGIQYLIIQKYIGSDEDILGEFDIRIMELDPLHINNYGLENGLEGFSWYLLSRLYNSKKNKLDSSYLSNFFKACTHIEPKDRTEAIKLFIKYYSKKEKSADIFSPILYKIIYQKIATDDIFSWQLGLQKIVL